MTETIRILIADDHLIVREGLQTILDTAPDLELVGEARDGVEAVKLAGELLPDVVLMDLRMPRMDGIEAIRQIKAKYPQLEIVILTTYDEDDYIVKGLQAGARGYLLKDSGRQALFDTIHAGGARRITAVICGDQQGGCTSWREKQRAPLAAVRARRWKYWD